MCDINTLQQKIADLTNNGEIVIRFLAETVQGKTPAVQPCHRLEATSQLIRLGYPDRHSRESGNPVAQTRNHPFHPCQTTTGPPSRHSLSLSKDTRPRSRGERQSSPNSRGIPVIPTPIALSEESTTDRSRQSYPFEITYLDILNFNLAQLIRSETADGHTIVEFLLHIMTGRDSAYTPTNYASSPQTAWQHQEKSSEEATDTSADAAG